MPKFTRWIEDRPTLHGLFVGFVLLGLLAVLLAVSGCGTATEDRPAPASVSVAPRKDSLDHAGKLACDAFAQWLAGDQATATRPKVASQVLDLAVDSYSGALVDKAELLVKPGVYGSNENWLLAADALAYECQVLGWTP